jgi:hypothetical protein
MFRIFLFFLIFFVIYAQFYSLKTVSLGNNHINQVNNPEKDVFEKMINQKQPLVITNVLGELAFTTEEIEQRDNDSLKKKVKDHFKYYLTPLSYDFSFKILFDKKGIATSLVKQINHRMLIASVKGIKKIILFNPDQTKYLYKSKITPNKSEVNFWQYSSEVYPNFSKSNYIEIIIRENQMISIPYGWWWTSICETDCLSVICYNDSLFSCIFKKMGVIN